jgi:hypothetical protein
MAVKAVQQTCKGPRLNLLLDWNREGIRQGEACAMSLGCHRSSGSSERVRRNIVGSLGLSGGLALGFHLEGMGDVKL